MQSVPQLVNLMIHDIDDAGRLCTLTELDDDDHALKKKQTAKKGVGQIEEQPKNDAGHVEEQPKKDAGHVEEPPKKKTRKAKSKAKSKAKEPKE